MELLTAEKPGASHVCCPGGALPEERMPNPLLFYFSQACVHLIDQNRWQSGWQGFPRPRYHSQQQQWDV